jgi:hypothetical protein
VDSQAYASAGWGALVQFWTDYNTHLLRVIAQIPEEKVGTICRIGDDPPLTLGELIDSYVDHLEHHLNQVLGYSGAGQRRTGHRPGAMRSIPNVGQDGILRPIGNRPWS